jgi:hypothetical protein
MKLSESMLRSIVKQELKKALNESNLRGTMRVRELYDTLMNVQVENIKDIVEQALFGALQGGANNVKSGKIGSPNRGSTADYDPMMEYVVDRQSNPPVVKIYYLGSPNVIGKIPFEIFQKAGLL